MLGGIQPVLEVKEDPRAQKGQHTFSFGNYDDSIVRGKDSVSQPGAYGGVQRGSEKKLRQEALEELPWSVDEQQETREFSMSEGVVAPGGGISGGLSGSEGERTLDLLGKQLKREEEGRRPVLIDDPSEGGSASEIASSRREEPEPKLFEERKSGRSPLRIETGDELPSHRSSE